MEEINYQELNTRIKMLNCQSVATENTITISKKNKAYLTNIEESLIELEVLKVKLEQSEQRNKELTKEIATIRSESAREIATLKSESVKEIVKIKKESAKEIATLRSELAKASENKTIYKDFVKNLELEFDKLPSTKDKSRKIELVRVLIDYVLAILAIMETLPFKPSIRFGYRERNKVIKYMLDLSVREVSEHYIGYCNHLENRFPDGIPKDGMLHNSGHKIKTLDDFIEYCL